MAELIKLGSPRMRDAAALVSIIIGLGVVASSTSSYFLIQERLKDNIERIRSIEAWRYEHEQTATQRNLYLLELKERVDACCPFYRGHK